ncbi:cell division transport system permease protein [Desulfomicrobium norvegicum]|uniref:Cell division protein FtsX n=1 Tax=Desulfomicrobium norvegicum (strain DSM 1741 / NCIMB 8310) TaxID=52561 RepID=A0A8G2F6J9_DESNO|nr:permease-like cell division protein FtsX [Desulfomicrobium norvegicum]SFL43806.1 cell division transport system permease protein [Desulfomicrobium norvegicum]
MNVFFQLIGQGVRDLFRAPWSLCMTIAAITLVSFLGGAFLMLVHNLDLQIGNRQGNVQFQVFWQADVASDELKEVWSGLSSMEGVVNVRTFTPDQALGVLEESFQKNVDLDWMKGRSPLPPTALVECDLPAEDGKKWAAGMVRRLEGLPKVEKVTFNPLQVDLLTSWVGLTKMAFWPVTGFLLVVVGLVVGNTIKLALLARRDELEILRFVGASRAYIQFPLLVGGAFQGLLGAGLALGLLKLLHHGIEDMFNVPPLWITISFLPQIHSLAILAILASVGVLSSLVAFRN